MQLVGGDAEYLRKVWFLLVMDDRQQLLINFLITIASNSNGDEPIVMALSGAGRPVNISRGGSARQLEAMIGKRLAETGDVGRVWQELIGRVLFSTSYMYDHGVFDFEISDEVIMKQMRCPRRRKRNPKHLSIRGSR